MNLTTVLWAVGAIIGVPLALYAYLMICERSLLRMRAPHRARVRPWLWLAPALSFLAVFLLYPVVNTAVLSLMDAKPSGWVGLRNYQRLLGDPTLRIVLRNNALWLCVFTAVTVVAGLAIATLCERVKYDKAIKLIVFLPMAISFVAAGVIWKLVYQYQPPGEPQTGVLNAVLSVLIPHFEPRAWLVDRATNNWALIAVGVWMWTGFAVVILSAGLRSIPESLIEAARMDGANGWQLFFRIVLPLMKANLTVVTTTLVIVVLKIFDIVYVMTNGSLDTDVIANRMYKEMFVYRDFGLASAVAMMLLLTVIPIMVVNIRKFGREP